jgi:hypothetical protein
MNALPVAERFKLIVRQLTLVSLVAMIFPLSAFCGTEKLENESAQKSTQLSKSDMKYKNVYIANFTISPQGVQESDPKDILTETQSSCTNDLLKSALFEKVKQREDKDATTSSLIVQGELTELKVVGTAARIWLGALAGRSKMSVHVKLIDATTGLIVAEKDIKEDSNPMAGAYSMGSSDRALPAVLGGLIADYSISNAKK